VSVSTGLLLPTDALTEAAAQIVADIERKVASSEQASRVVRALERRYDSLSPLTAGPRCWPRTSRCPRPRSWREAEAFLPSRRDHGTN